MDGNNRGLILGLIVVLILILGGILVYANYNSMSAVPTDTTPTNESISNSQTEGLENNNTTSSTTATSSAGVNTNVSGSITY